MCWFVKNSRILDFLVRLNKDPALLAAYKADPQAVMAQAGLNAEEQKALLTKSKPQVVDALLERDSKSTADARSGKKGGA